MIGNPTRLSRRLFVTGSFTTPLLATFPNAIAQDQPVDPATLKPGTFQWQPNRSPQGPVVVLVSIPKQWVVVYRGGVRIAASSCSTGKSGHTTPSASSFVISTADRKLTAFVNGKQSFTAPVGLKFPEKPFGTHAFTLTGPDSDPRHMKWLAVGLQTGSNVVLASALLASETINRIDLTPDTARRVIALMHPGSTLVVTDHPSNDEHRTEPDFTIITHDT